MSAQPIVTAAASPAPGPVSATSVHDRAAATWRLNTRLRARLPHEVTGPGRVLSLSTHLNQLGTVGGQEHADTARTILAGMTLQEALNQLVWTRDGQWVITKLRTALAHHLIGADLALLDAAGRVGGPDLIRAVLRAAPHDDWFGAGAHLDCDAGDATQLAARYGVDANTIVRGIWTGTAPGTIAAPVAAIVLDLRPTVPPISVKYTPTRFDPETTTTLLRWSRWRAATDRTFDQTTVTRIIMLFGTPTDAQVADTVRADPGIWQLVRTRVDPTILAGEVGEAVVDHLIEQNRAGIVGSSDPCRLNRDTLGDLLDHHPMTADQLCASLTPGILVAWCATNGTAANPATDDLVTHLLAHGTHLQDWEAWDRALRHFGVDNVISKLPDLPLRLGDMRGMTRWIRRTLAGPELTGHARARADLALAIATRIIPEDRWMQLGHPKRIDLDSPDRLLSQV